MNRPALALMLLRALGLRCPNCGQRGIVRRWFGLAEVCPRCRLLFEREEGFFLGAYVVNFGVSEGALAIFMIVAFVVTSPDPPTAWLATAGGALMVAVPIAFYPFSKTIWTAIYLLMQPHHPNLRQ